MHFISFFIAKNKLKKKQIWPFAKISSRETSKKFIHENKFSWKLIPLRYRNWAFPYFVIACSYFFRWDTHLYMSLFPSVCPTDHPSVMHHISGIFCHLIIIFGAHVLNDISRGFFYFFEMKKLKITKWKIAKSKEKIKNNNYIHLMSHLRNSIAYDHEF